MTSPLHKRRSLATSTIVEIRLNPQSKGLTVNGRIFFFQFHKGSI
nr:MAG TPA: hypothetical protein [Caudoviricetes sp.]